MLRVLVTGGSGYLGSAIVRALARRGHQPMAFSRHSLTSRTTLRAIRGDLRSRADVEAAVGQCDAVCHAGALVSLWRRRSRDFDDVNVDGTRHVIEACRARGVHRVIYTASFLALPPAGRTTPLTANDYQRTKVAALTLVRDAVKDGDPIVVLVPGVIYGPGLATEGNLVGRLLRDHLAGRLPGIVGGDRLWSFAWIEDVADAHVSALERGEVGTEYAVGGENAASRRIFEVARAVTGRPLPRRLPPVLVRLAGAAEEIRARIGGPPPRVTRGAVDIFMHDWPLDTRRAVGDLGYAPRALD
ncbi:MAG: NAD-dependent epimerase/dehydratase family protein, partial [Gemmatimonadales bacterium]